MPEGSASNVPRNSPKAKRLFDQKFGVQLRGLVALFLACGGLNRGFRFA
jgi:hypothetical protein